MTHFNSDTRPTLYRHRQLWILAGERHWSQSTARIMAHQHKARLWITDEAPKGEPQRNPQQAQQTLGQELDLLVFDIWAGLDPDALAATAGMVRGGGHLILLVPPLDQWATHPDPYLKRLCQYPHNWEQLPVFFIRRLIERFKGEPSIRWLESKSPIPQLSAPAPPVDQLQPTADQQAAVTALEHLVSGHRRRPLLLIADRGRGKSTALGLGAARLLQNGIKQILVTAPRPDMANTVFRQAQRHWQACQGMSPLHLSNASRDKALRFIAPDALLQERPDTDLLLVDEAAAIPLPLLEAMLKHYSRIAFATTQHGYEGAGRGFALRFRQILDREAPGWQCLKMTQPVRWAADDPLEEMLFRTLLLNTESAEIRADEAPEVQHVEHQWLSPEALIGDEEKLRQLFGLLVSAHYQTRPSDLRRLLDGPDTQLLVLIHDDQILGTLISQDEGDLPATEAEAIWLGKRRLRGHLIPQTLSSHAGFRQATGFCYRRISRIAVHPAFRRLGLGQRLLEAARTRAREEGRELLGVSFAASTGLLPFWLRADFRPVRMGYRREAASGAHSLIMLAPLQAHAEAFVSQLQHRFAESLPLLLAEPLRDLEPELTALLWRCCPPGPSLSYADREDLTAFAYGQRDYAGARLALWHLCLAVRGTRFSIPAEWVLKILQSQPWHRLSPLGRRMGEHVMRQQIQSWLVQNTNENNDIASVGKNRKKNL